MSDAADRAAGAGTPLPDLTDPVTAPFWNGTRNHRLTAPRCTACRQLLWPPELACPECYGTTFDWEYIPQTGVIWSYATYHRALDPAFADRLPYVVGLVVLLPGVKMYGIVVDDPDRVRIGDRVDAVFEDVTDEVTLVRWRPV